MPDFPTQLSDSAAPFLPPRLTPVRRAMRFQVMLCGRAYTGEKIQADEIHLQGPLQIDCFGELCQIRIQFDLSPLMLGITLPAIVLPNPKTSDGITLALHHPTPEQRQGLQMLLDHFSTPEGEFSTLLAHTDQLLAPVRSTDWLRKFSGALRQRFFH